jgi:hypothetical protein
MKLSTFMGIPRDEFYQLEKESDDERWNADGALEVYNPPRPMRLDDLRTVNTHTALVTGQRWRKMRFGKS